MSVCNGSVGVSSTCSVTRIADVDSRTYPQRITIPVHRDAPGSYVWQPEQSYNLCTNVCLSSRQRFPLCKPYCLAVHASLGLSRATTNIWLSFGPKSPWPPHAFVPAQASLTKTSIAHHPLTTCVIRRWDCNSSHVIRGTTKLLMTRRTIARRMNQKSVKKPIRHHLLQHYPAIRASLDDAVS